ncbi:MAG: DNA-formamidopyrimidine glycosylase family protein [Acidimicrobiia bacterium]
MPELPAVQALAERIDALLRGARLTGCQQLAFSGLKTAAPPPDSLVGAVLAGTDRRGKFLLLDFGGGGRIAIHLSQAGRITFEDPPKATRPKGGVARFAFEDRPALLLKEFGTERKAGWWVLAHGDEGPLGRLGPEPDSDEFAELILHGSDGRRLHTMLRDQRTVAGIGRGYADDLLHEARLSPMATLSGLDDDGRGRLATAVVDTLARGLADERTREGGLPPKLGEFFRIHKHAGEPCPRCGDVLQRVSYESHEVVYCPRCQTGGKVYADRRLSRLLK